MMPSGAVHPIIPGRAEGASAAIGPRNDELRRLAEAVIQRVAGAAHGADRVGLAAAVERLAQAADVHVDGALVDIDLARITLQRLGKRCR